MARRVVAFGSFDIIHPGHLHYLQGASRYGDLYVVVARDGSIKKLKGRSPLIDEQARLEIIQSLRFVHKALLGDRIRKWNDIYKILLKVKPDVIALGYDQKVDTKYMTAFLLDHGLKTKIVRIKSFKSSKYKSSKLKKLMSIY